MYSIRLALSVRISALGSDPTRSTAPVFRAFRPSLSTSLPTKHDIYRHTQTWCCAQDGNPQSIRVDLAIRHWFSLIPLVLGVSSGKQTECKQHLPCAIVVLWSSVVATHLFVPLPFCQLSACSRPPVFSIVAFVPRLILKPPIYIDSSAQVFICYCSELASQFATNSFVTWEWMTNGMIAFTCCLW